MMYTAVYTDKTETIIKETVASYGRTSVRAYLETIGVFVSDTIEPAVLSNLFNSVAAANGVSLWEINIVKVKKLNGGQAITTSAPPTTPHLNRTKPDV